MNVFVVARSAPASKYASWISVTMSGRVRLRRSGFPLHVAAVVAEPLAAVLGLREPAPMDQDAPRPVVDRDPPIEDLA